MTDWKKYPDHEFPKDRFFLIHDNRGWSGAAVYVGDIFRMCMFQMAAHLGHEMDPSIITHWAELPEAPHD